MIKNKDDICYAGDSNDRLGGMEYNIVQLLNTIVEYLVVPQQNTTDVNRAEGIAAAITCIPDHEELQGDVWGHPFLRASSFGLPLAKWLCRV